jgi:cytidylate kinase
MIHIHAPEHLSDTLTRLERHWEDRRSAASAGETSPSLSHPFSITIAREAGTEGTSLGREVGRRLGWQVYDHELLERIARDLGLRTGLLQSLDERRRTWLEESLAGLSSRPAVGVSEIAYVHQLVKTVLALGASGECVIVGRGASFILPARTTLRVRLMAPLHDRIASLARRLGISEHEAARQVRTLDRERGDFVHDHFHRDPTDPRHYDLLLNASRFSVPTCADIIIDTLKHLQAAVEKS